MRPLQVRHRIARGRISEQLLQRFHDVGMFFFDPLATAAWLADAGVVEALRSLEFSLPPADRRATHPGDDRQPLDPSSTVDRRPEASAKTRRHFSSRVEIS